MIEYHSVAFYIGHSFGRANIVTVGCILHSSPTYAETERVTAKLRESHSKHSEHFVTMYFTHKYIDGQKGLFDEREEAPFLVKKGYTHA